ncbi:dyslexia-associated protein KIAA0319-like protein [Stomoxys calcitrans]|uniref:MANSC domain-containing protein n=1 Tax=Stomoxys calcitrans TaxID=35570 RepID=A0A1I8PKJ6_STOCA|nr:dyslexia-associated protein KIAA0319-like protein [Stomoxys calcitrans]
MMITRFFIAWEMRLLVLLATYVVAILAADTAVTTEIPTAGHEVTQGDTPVSTRNVGDGDLTVLCPNMVRYVFESAMPHDESKSGIYEKYPSTDEGEVDLRTCVEACCEKGRNNTCNVVFMFKRKCYHVRCVSNEACLPKERRTLPTGRIQMVLVNPVRSDTQKEKYSWLDTLKSSKALNEMMPFDETEGNENINSLNFWKQPHKLPYYSRTAESSPGNYDEDDDFPLAEKRVKQLLMSSPLDENEGILPEDLSYYRANLSPESAALTNFLTCSPDMTSEGATRCALNEECVSVDTNTGICKCIRGFVRNHLRVCVPDSMDYNLMDETGAAHNIMMASASSNEATTMQKPETEPTPKTEPNKKLMVSVVSKEVRLPEKEVTLAAFTVPDEQSSNTKYKYLWTLINQPKSPMNGTISDQSQSKVKLSNLSEGLYTFKVTVTGDNGTYGEGMANVTVLPEKRINRVPQVIITPSEQTIRQPTTNAILDGSTSIDDDKIVSWHWEVVSGPIGYQPKLPEVNTLQLTDLTSPGNYTFKLTVTDTDNVTNSTTANVTVLKGTDYPPVANAGDAVILYLPNNNVTLNGTASSDDHEIVAWEWTKDASDEAKAVDMQNTRTPYVQLSNLEEGMYTFVLKVTDGSGQSSTAKVHVFVKPPTNSPPVAVAGTNMTINLPTNWITLNGSASTDDIGIKSYEWKEVSGPNTAMILRSNETVANATGLTLGAYEFQLTVVDESNNTASDHMWLKVVQEKNSPPVANAGGDQSITLPVSAIYFNGSASSDDLGVSKYQWTREDASLAAGKIVGNTDSSPIMILTNLVSGRYVFKLTVSDDQGLTSSDTASVFIHPDPMLLNLVQLTLPMNISMLTHSALTTIVQKIGLLMGDMKIQVRDLQHDSRTNAAILVFYVELQKAGKTSPVDGLTIERLLKEKLQRDASILGTVFADVRTMVCQNKCSGHGVCNSDTRACFCEAFWMPSFGYFWGFEEANCDWSVLYVFVGVIVSLLLLSAIFWGIAIACRQTKKPRSRPKVQKYSLIGTQDEEAPNYSRTSLTDSETDSDVLFESRSKSNGILRLNGTSKNRQNGHDRSKYPGKHGRKIKT